MEKKIAKIFLLISILLLCACANKVETKPVTHLPPCPKPSPNVARELKPHCNDSTCPATLDFFNRFYKVCDILDSNYPESY